MTLSIRYRWTADCGWWIEFWRCGYGCWWSRASDGDETCHDSVVSLIGAIESEPAGLTEDDARRMVADLERML